MAVKFDRGSFKATKSEALKVKEKESGMSQRRRGQGGDIVYHSIDQGDNKFRIYPYHPDAGGNTYCEYKAVSFLPVMVDKYDESGNKIEGEQELKRKPIPNSITHGGFKYDLVEAYMEAGKRIAEDMDKKEKEDYLEKLYHFKNGVRINRSWVTYADKYIDDKPVFGILEFSNAVKNEINKSIATEDEGDEMSNDPFSHPDEGICLIVNKTGERLNTKYACSLEKKKTGKFSFDLVPTPLTDEQLEKFMEQDSLFSMFKSNFKRRHFIWQIEGLQRVDEENQLHIFDEDEEFNNIMEYLSEAIPEDKEETSTETKKEEKPEPEKKSSKVDEFKSRPEQKLDLHKEDESAPWDEDEEENNEEEEKPDPKTENKTSDIKAKLAEMRAKMKTGK